MDKTGYIIFVTDKESPFVGEWGIIKKFDGEYYHVAIANDTSAMPVFRRNEFKIPRNQDYYRNLFKGI